MRNVPLTFVAEESLRLIRAAESKHEFNKRPRSRGSVPGRAIDRVLSVVRFVFDLRHLDGPYALAQYERLQQLR
jgi:hypothetical protein